MSSLASLVVDLSVNSAAMRDGMAKAVDTLKNFERTSSEIGEGIKKLGELAVVELGKRAVEGIAEFVAKGAEAADRLGKMAQAAGEPVEEFTRLAYAMGLSGLSGEETGVAFSKLNKQIALAASGVAQSAALFNALGVKVKDSAGNVRAADAVLGDLADRFAGMKDGASKSALAIEVFGKSGAALVPFLNRGSAGIKELEAECDRLGITLSGAAVEAATEFNDNLVRMRAVSNALAMHVAAELSPAFKALTDELLKSNQSSVVFGDAAHFIATSIKVLTTVAIQAVAGIEGLWLTIKGVATATADAAAGQFSKAGAAIKEMFADQEKSAAQAQARMDAVWKEPTKAVAELAKAEKEAADARQKAFEDGIKWAADYKEALKSLEKVATAEELKVSSFGQGPVALMADRLGFGDLSKELAKLGPAAKAMADRIYAAAKNFEQLKEAAAKVASDFSLGRTNAVVDQAGAQAQIGYGDIGKSDSDVFQRLTAGFGSYQQALEANITAIKVQNTALAEAALEQAKGTEAGRLAARGLDLVADKSKQSAEVSSVAMAAFSASATKAAAANQGYFDTMHKIALDAEQLAKDTANRMNQGGVSMFGESPETQRLVAQYDSLGQALDRFAQFTRAAAEQHAEGARLLALGDRTGAQAAEDVARHFTDLAADSSKAASAIEDMSARVNATMENAASGIASKLGEAGNVINGALQGFKSGGIIGAIIGAIVAIIDKFKGFAGIMDGINAQLDKIIGALDPGISAILNLIQTIADVSNAITPLVPTLRFVSDILTFVALTMEGTILGIESVWAWIQGFFDKAGQAATQKNIDALKQQMTDQWKSLSSPISGATVGDAMKDKNAGSADDPVGTSVSDGLTSDFTKFDNQLDKTVNHLAKLNEQLTNVPQGFKTALRRFQAMAAPKDTSKSGNQMSQDPHNTHPPTSVNVTVTGGVMVTVKDLVKAVTDGIAQNSFQRKGTQFGR